MERYIEVIGESTLIETVQEYLADINLSVRAAQSKTAFDEVIGLRDRCIEALLSSGLARSELKEGGAEAWRTWFSRKKTGQEAFQKIIVTCTEIGRLMQALSALEPLFENPRYSFTLNMHRPVFSASAATQQQSRQMAIQAAYAHARLLATETQLALVEVAQIEELDKVTGNSGVYGDETWQAVMAGGTAPDAEELSYSMLDHAVRDIKLRYRVRFLVEAIN